MKPILVTSYVNPDLDGVACAVAYAEFLEKVGKSATAGAIGEVHVEARYLLDRFDITPPERLTDANEFESIILVDTSDLKDLEGKISSERVIEIIDHRKVDGAGHFLNAKVQIEFVGAAATLIAEKFITTQTDISRNSAILLFGAIISNTLNFQASVTTDRDRKAANWLNKIANLPESFSADLFKAKSDLSGDRLRKSIEGDFNHFEFGSKKIGIAQLEILGASILVSTREAEITHILQELKSRMNLDFIFQNTIGLDEGKSIFVAGDEETKRLLENVFQVSFHNMASDYSGLIMRKEIAPRLREALNG